MIDTQSTACCLKSNRSSQWECTGWKKSQYLHLSVTHAAGNIPKYSFWIQKVWFFSVNTPAVSKFSVSIFIEFVSSSYMSRIWLTVFCRCFCSRLPIGREQHCTDQWKSSWSRRILPALCSCFDCVCSASFGTIKVSLPLFVLTFESWQPKLLLTKWRKMLWSYKILFWQCIIWFLWFISTTGTIFQTCKDMRRLKIG